MTENYCKKCTNVKIYDGKYRCMTCYRKFTIADQEDVMNEAAIAPALARIKELENQNRILELKLKALLAATKAARNPVATSRSQCNNGRSHELLGQI